jgi:hypothetical protein
MHAATRSEDENSLSLPVMALRTEEPAGRYARGVGSGPGQTLTKP